jgi:hypothetical protein
MDEWQVLIPDWDKMYFLGLPLNNFETKRWLQLVAQVYLLQSSRKNVALHLNHCESKTEFMSIKNRC